MRNNTIPSLADKSTEIITTRSTVTDVSFRNQTAERYYSLLKDTTTIMMNTLRASSDKLSSMLTTEEMPLLTGERDRNTAVMADTMTIPTETPKLLASSEYFE